MISSWITVQSSYPDFVAQSDHSVASWMDQCSPWCCFQILCSVDPRCCAKSRRSMLKSVYDSHLRSQETNLVRSKGKTYTKEGHICCTSGGHHVSYSGTYHQGLDKDTHSFSCIFGTHNFFSFWCVYVLDRRFQVVLDWYIEEQGCQTNRRDISHACTVCQLPFAALSNWLHLINGVEVASLSHPWLF